MSKSHIFALEQELLLDPTFHFWWNYSTEDKESEHGFELGWWIEKGNLTMVQEFVSREMSGSVQTPEFGSLGSNSLHREYSAVIEMPHNISEIIEDGSLMVSVEVGTQLESEVEL